MGELLFRFREHHARLGQAHCRIGAEGQVAGLAAIADRAAGFQPVGGLLAWIIH